MATLRWFNLHRVPRKTIFVITLCCALHAFQTIGRRYFTNRRTTIVIVRAVCNVSASKTLEPSGHVTTPISLKINDVLSKNHGSSRITNLAPVLICASSELPWNIGLSLKADYNWTHVTKSFSEFEYFSRSNWTLFTQEHLQQHIDVFQ